eukprot:gene12640-14848_t
MFTNTFIFLGYAVLRFIPPPKGPTSAKYKPITVVPTQKFVMLAVFDAVAKYVFTSYEVSPFAFAATYGYYSVVVCLVYMITVTMANLQEWVVAPLALASHNNIVAVIFLFSVLIVTSVIRSSAVFTVISTYGTVTMGVLYALQSIVVFFSSALFLCDPNHPTKAAQCITTPKLFGSALVIAGSFIYSVSSASVPHVHTPPSSPSTPTQVAAKPTFGAKL